MHLEKTDFTGLYVINPEIIEDNRGYFAELFRADLFKLEGVDIAFVQQNVSVSKTGVVRGLHFQWQPPLGKLVSVTEGRVFAVGVDLRKSSPTFKNFFALELSRENKKRLYLSPGFAFGFGVVGGPAELEYLYTAPYNPQGESNIIWDDKMIGINWPIKNPTLSIRDASAQTLDEWLKRPESNNF